jgi:hypothetical protein
MKTLVAGWFSFEQMGASAGDLLVRDLACGWLAEAGRDYDVAVAEPFSDGVDWRTVDPDAYEELLFVCGPAGNGKPLTDMLARFEGKRLVGLNLTMLQPLDEWNPFDVLFERDSSRTAHPDLAFLAAAPRVPVVGLVQIDAQPEYGERDRHTDVDAAIDRLVARRDIAAVRIDTRLDTNSTGLRSAAAVESLIARMDMVITTRLHGLVLAIKNGVPALAIDTVTGGAKVSRQAEVIGWPIVLAAEKVSDDALSRALDTCLTAEARANALTCAETARQSLLGARDAILRDL